MSQIQYLDELVREYLLFRGFTSSLKAFDVELKQDKDKGFRVDKIVDQILHHINQYDLNSLRDLWNHLDQRMFSKLENDLSHGVRKLESSVFKLYLVNAAINNKTDKITEFFNKMTPELHGQSEWREWFVLAHLKNPEESPYFSVYFSKHWQDTLIVSLHNFLSLIIQVMPMPVLASYEDEANRVRKLEEENESLRQRLTTLSQCTNAIMPSDSIPPPADIMDDFYIIAQESAGSSGEVQQSKSIKNLMRNIGGGSQTSPPQGRKQSQSDKTLLAPRGSQPPWIRHSPGGDSVPKRSLSLDSRRGGRENSAERRPITKRDNFLLLSQDKMSDHKAAVTQCRLSSTGTYVASSDENGMLKIWTYTPQPQVAWGIETGGSITGVDWLGKNERYLVAGTNHGVLRLYDLCGQKVIWQTGTDQSSPLYNTRITSLCSSLCQSYIACTTVDSSTGQNAGIFLFDLKSTRIEYSLKMEAIDKSDLVSDCCMFNHTGSLVLCGCSDGSIRTLDLRFSECLDLWEAHTGPVCALRLTSDLNACYSFGNDHRLCRHNMAQNGDPMWSASLSRTCGSASSHGTQAFALHQSGSHALIACGSTSPSIYQVSSSGLAPVMSLGETSKDGRVVACDWASANQCSTCVTGYSDGLIKIATILTP